MTVLLLERVGGLEDLQKDPLHDPLARRRGMYESAKAKAGVPDLSAF
jgi:hypothetical protein